MAQSDVILSSLLALKNEIGGLTSEVREMKEKVEDIGDRLERHSDAIRDLQSRAMTDAELRVVRDRIKERAAAEATHDRRQGNLEEKVGLVAASVLGAWIISHTQQLASAIHGLFGGR